MEEHTLTTTDGYILKVFRIPGRKDEGRKVKPVAYFQHGLLDSADCWVMNYAEKAPAFILARAGYDVWLGNSRGNKYSHDAYPEKSKKDYWGYGFEDMGDNDITNVIDYILRITKQPKLAYIGHS